MAAKLGDGISKNNWKCTISGHAFNNSSADGVLINNLVLGVNTLTVPGGNQQFLNIDTSSDEGSSQISIELDTNTGWRRRSWHRINF